MDCSSAILHMRKEVGLSMESKLATVVCTRVSACKSSLCRAVRSASSLFQKQAKPVPLDRPVLGSFVILA